jgi:uncharacterized membrane protein YukC
MFSRKEVLIWWSIQGKGEYFCHISTSKRLRAEASAVYALIK